MKGLQKCKTDKLSFSFLGVGGDAVFVYTDLLLRFAKTTGYWPELLLSHFYSW